MDKAHHDLFSVNINFAVERFPTLDFSRVNIQWLTNFILHVLASGNSLRQLQQALTGDDILLRLLP